MSLHSIWQRFFRFLDSPEADRWQAYCREYLDPHRAFFTAYAENYLPGLEWMQERVRALGPGAWESVRQALRAETAERLAREACERCTALLPPEAEVEIYLFIGFGAANAFEGVSDGVPFIGIALEQYDFTTPVGYPLQIPLSQIPLWLAHEWAHCVRYTGSSRSEIRRVIGEGSYSYREVGEQVTLRELLVNEGLSVEFSRRVCSGWQPWDYLGYDEPFYRWCVAHEAELWDEVRPLLDQRSLDLRRKYFTGDPGRIGYYLGWRSVQAYCSAYPAADFRELVRAEAEVII